MFLCMELRSVSFFHAPFRKRFRTVFLCFRSVNILFRPFYAAICLSFRRGENAVRIRGVVEPMRLRSAFLHRNVSKALGTRAFFVLQAVGDRRIPSDDRAWFCFPSDRLLKRTLPLSVSKRGAVFFRNHADSALLSLIALCRSHNRTPSKCSSGAANRAENTQNYKK